MSEQKQQRPLIRIGTVLEWSGSKMEVLAFGRGHAVCKITETGTVVNVPLHHLESATVLTENPVCPRCKQPPLPISCAPEEWGNLPDWEDNGSDWCCFKCKYTFEGEEAYHAN